MSKHDLVIRGGTVVDGTGAPARTADVAVNDGVITEVGRSTGRRRRAIDADGPLVTPGFVDIHTHYDGQATWDERLIPSSWHGVTTVVAGNCGVGFAPVPTADHDRLIELMEGVEDIPGVVLHEGLRGTGSLPRVPRRARRPRVRRRRRHCRCPTARCASTSWASGARHREPATPEDIAQMAGSPPTASRPARSASPPRAR